jgi:hypothetical protein
MNHFGHTYNAGELSKIPTIDFFDERAIDDFIIRLQQADLVEDMGRIKPKTVAKLMDIANRFADGEAACH